MSWTDTRSRTMVAFVLLAACGGASTPAPSAPVAPPDRADPAEAAEPEQIEQAQPDREVPRSASVEPVVDLPPLDWRPASTLASRPERWVAPAYVLHSPGVTETLLLQRERPCGVRGPDGAVMPITIEEDGAITQVGRRTFSTQRRRRQVTWTATNGPFEQRVVLHLEGDRFATAELSSRASGERWRGQPASRIGYDEEGRLERFVDRRYTYDGPWIVREWVHREGPTFEEMCIERDPDGRIRRELFGRQTDRLEDEPPCEHSPHERIFLYDEHGRLAGFEGYDEHEFIYETCAP